MVDLLSPFSDFSVYECHGSIPFWASSISDSPEGQPTDIYISKTTAWLPELGMLKTPRLAFSRLPTLAALPLALRKGSRQVGPHRFLGVSKGEEMIPPADRTR